MKYIDADLLRENIVREVEQWKEKTANHYTIEAEARWSEANYILGIFDSLQQEQQEVDLEEAYKEFCKDYPFPWSSQYVNREYIDELCLSVARHFYEIGKKQ